MAEEGNGDIMERQRRRQGQRVLDGEVQQMAKAQSSFSYENVAFDIEEIPIFDFDDHMSDCLMDQCDVCSLKEKLERQALEWKEKVEEIVGSEWEDDAWSVADEYIDLIYYPETNETVDVNRLVNLERRSNVFHYVDLFVETIIDSWHDGLPFNANHNLSNLCNFVSNDEMNVLDKTYNWNGVIEYLTTEINRELLLLPFNDLRIGAHER